MKCEERDATAHAIRTQRREFWPVRLLAIGSIWALLSTLSLPVVLYAWPDVEARVWPVLVEQSVDTIRVTEDGKFQKFYWNYTKNRRARIEFAAFMAFVDPREKYTTDVFVGEDCTDNFRTSRQTEVGQRLRKLLCVRIPEPLRGRGPVQIRGLIEWNVGHGVYTVPDLIPPVTVWGNAKAEQSG